MNKITLTILLLSAFFTTRAQQTENKGLYSGANFLTIGPDARSGAMGSIGAATAPDVYSIYWNAAKTIFNESTMEVSYTYSPWMREITDDMNMSALGFFRKIDDVQAISLGFRYFSFGKIDFTDQDAVFMGEHKPYEMSIDLAYSRKLGENLSAALTLKYVRSQLGMGQMVSGAELSAANAVAADISVFYNRNLSLLGKNTTWRAGFVMGNIGSKLKYGEDAEEAWLPGTLRLGTSLETHFNERNSLLLSIEGNSLLSPAFENGKVPNKSGVGGYFSSIGDINADNLFFAAGAEYWFARTVAIRAGYHYGNDNSGKPSYFTTGFGVKYFNLMADFSYVAAISGNNPLRNSLQFSIGVDLDFFKKK